MRTGVYTITPKDPAFNPEILINTLQLHVYGKWWQSENCCNAISYAHTHGIKVRYKEGTGFEGIRSRQEA